METTCPHTRILLAPLLLAGLVAGGLAMPPASALAVIGVQFGADCCREVAAACCNSACCQAQAPISQRSPSQVPKRTDDRPPVGKLGWVTTAFANVSAGTAFYPHGNISAAVHFGSPSLIAQHIRLQI